MDSMLLLRLPNAVRLRNWRTLEAVGCAAPPDGVQLLAAARGERFESLAAKVREHAGARSPHVGGLISFEVRMASFGLKGDTKLQRMAATVRYFDVGGIPTPQASGLESLLAGQRELHADDAVLVSAASATFDATYAARTGTAPGRQGIPP
jgi:hypothetical protein